MRVLVTGGSGFVGRYVVEELAGKHEVTVFDNKKPARSDVKFISGNILDTEGLDKAMKDIDAVIHLAAIPRPMPEWSSEKLFEINAAGTFNVLEAATKNKVKRFVLASSDSSLGFVFRTQDFDPEYLPIDEAHPQKPQDCYGLSKMVSEQICLAFTRKTGIETVCLRICFVWFPENKNDYKPLTEKPDLWWKGLWVYQDVRDAATAFRLAIETPGLKNENIFISADDNGTATDSLELIKKYFPNVKKIDESKLKGRASLISNEKAKKLLGFRPMYPWKKMLGE